MKAKNCLAKKDSEMRWRGMTESSRSWGMRQERRRLKIVERYKNLQQPAVGITTIPEGRLTAVVTITIMWLMLIPVVIIKMIWVTIWEITHTTIIKNSMLIMSWVIYIKIIKIQPSSQQMSQFHLPVGSFCHKVAIVRLLMILVVRSFHSMIERIPI